MSKTKPTIAVEAEDEIETTIIGPPGKEPYRILLECGEELTFLSIVLTAASESSYREEFIQNEVPMRGLAFILRDLEAKLGSVDAVD